MKFDFQARKFLAPFVILGSALLTVACGDDDNAEPTKPPVVGDEDAGGGGEDAGGGDDTTGGGENTTEGSVDTDDTEGPTNETDASVDTDEPVTTDGGVDATEEPVTTDGGGDTVVTPTDDGGGTTTEEPVGCVENEEACYSCPTAPEHFPLQCTEGECKAFDNSRLGRYVPGEDLPEP
jgi:hypothetical protein